MLNNPHSFSSDPDFKPLTSRKSDYLNAAEFDITAMIDLVFMMNIFFMVPRVAEVMVKEGDAKTIEEARRIILEQMGFKDNIQLDFTRSDIKAICNGAGVEASFEGLVKIPDAETLVSAIAFGMRQRRAAVIAQCGKQRVDGRTAGADDVAVDVVREVAAAVAVQVVAQ